MSIELGPPLDHSRTKGYDMGLVLVLETVEHIKSFAEHPTHLRSVEPVAGLFEHLLIC